MLFDPFPALNGAKGLQLSCACTTELAEWPAQTFACCVFMGWGWGWYRRHALCGQAEVKCATRVCMQCALCWCVALVCVCAVVM